MIAEEYLPPKIDENELASLMDLVSQIEATPSRSAEADLLVERFNARTGKSYVEREFRDYYGAVDLKIFVKGAMLPEPVKFPAVPDGQFLAMLSRLRDPDCDEAEAVFWLRFLARNLECDDIIDIIYWSDDDPSDSEILARARARKNSIIILPSNGG